MLASQMRTCKVSKRHHSAKSLQVRNGQLEKEARELRAENATLHEHVQQAKHAASLGEKVSHQYTYYRLIAHHCIPFCGSSKYAQLSFAYLSRRIRDGWIHAPQVA